MPISRFFFLLFFFPCTIYAQEIKISGIVIDSLGQPINQVAVLVQGTKIGTTSLANGQFNIGFATTAKVLIFSKTGYQTQHYMVSDIQPAKEIRIVMAEKVVESATIDIVAQSNLFNQPQTLNDEHNGYLLAGKKTEVISIATANANIALKNSHQLFAKIPGVFVFDLDGAGNQTSIATRGLDAHRSWEFNVRQNNVITNSDMYGYPASHYNVPMEAIEKVELVRGTGSLQYGAQFGGMINYVTKAPSEKQISFERITSVGSYGLFSNYTSLNGKIKKWQYNSYIYNRVYEGYRKNARSEGDAYFVSLQYNFSAKLYIKAEIGKTKYRTKLPGPLTEEMFGVNPRQSTRARNYYSPEIYVPSVQLYWAISKKTELRFTSSGVLGNRNSVQFIAFADVPDRVDTFLNDYKPRQVDIDRFRSFTNEVRINHKYCYKDINGTLAVGMQLINNRMIRKQQGKGTTNFDYDLGLTNPQWGRDMKYNTDNIALFVENAFYLTKKISLTPGIRYETGITHLKGSIVYYNPENVPLKIARNFALLGISAQYKINEKSSLYAGFSQAYRPIIFKDVIPANALEKIDPNLKDAFGYNAEAGFNGKHKNRITYNITAFTVQYNNRIGGLILKDTAGAYYNFKTNIGNSRTLGIEAYIEAVAVRHPKGIEVSVFTSTSYQNAVYTQGTVAIGSINTSIKNNKLEAVPTLISRNGITLQYKNFVTALQYSYTSQTFSDALNTNIPISNGSVGKVPAYGLFDITASLKFLLKYQIRAGINNISNLHYFTKRPTFYPDPGIWPSEGRTFFVTAIISL